MRGPLLLVAQHAGPSGGAGAHVETSARALRATGMDVMVVAGSGQAERVLPGIADDQIAPGLDQTFDRLLRDVAPAVIHVHDIHDDRLVDIARRHAPLVWSAHNYVGCTTGEHYFRDGSACTRAHGGGCVPNIVGRGCAHRWDVRDLPRLYRRATRVLAGMRRADAAVAYSGWMVDHLRVNDVPRRELVPLFVDVPAEPPQAPDEFRVGFFGRVVGGKGLDVAVKALRSVDVCLDVHGAGWAEAATRRLADRMGVGGRVQFHGWLEHDRLDEAYGRLSAVVVPSRWPEPFGLVGLEAFARCRPVAASDIGGIPEWLASPAGERFKPGDHAALAAILRRWRDDRPALQQMGVEGRRLVESVYTAERHVQVLRSVYERAREHWTAST